MQAAEHDAGRKIVPTEKVAGTNMGQPVDKPSIFNESISMLMCFLSQWKYVRSKIALMISSCGQDAGPRDGVRIQLERAQQ